MTTLKKVTKKELLNRIEKLENEIFTKDASAAEETIDKPDYKSFIGKKIKGFKFEGPSPHYSFGMNDCIGLIGTIESYCLGDNSFRVCFFNGRVYYYPTDLAIKHIVEEPDTTNSQISVTESEKEKVLLYLDMLQHARSVNEGWVPDWSVMSDTKWTLDVYDGLEARIDFHKIANQGVFGIAYKTKELAEQAKQKFSERILKYYGN